MYITMYELFRTATLELETLNDGCLLRKNVIHQKAFSSERRAMALRLRI